MENSSILVMQKQLHSLQQRMSCNFILVLLPFKYVQEGAPHTVLLSRPGLIKARN